MEINLCHDPQVAEVVGGPSYTDEFLSLLGPFGVRFRSIREGADADQRGHGILLNIGLNAPGYLRRFPSELPLAMMTVYYRLIGSPGTTTQLTLCDGVLAYTGSTCNFNSLYSSNTEPGEPPGWHYVSLVNVSGLLTVLPGPATNPDRPPEPPQARIYPELPSPEFIDFRVRVTGATAPPGALDVPVDVYAVAAVEYTGIAVPVDFDETLLRLSGAVLHVAGGVFLDDNTDTQPGAGPEEGNVILFSGYGINNRRLAAEDETIHLATLYFDVLATSSLALETSLNVVPITTRGIGHEAWIAVRHQAEGGDDITWTRIAPQVTINGVVAIRPEITTFRRGDANGDGDLDISDPVTTLDFLFVDGPQPHCLDAADANDDGQLDISDPVRTLGFLFLGGFPLPPPTEAPGEDPTPDGMGCLYPAPGE
jgi:hypothetical protein